MDATDRFYKLIWPHADMVLRVAQLLCRNSADAEDLAQETLTKAFRHLDQFQEGTEAKQWLMTILRNTRIDRARKLSGKKENVSLEDLTSDPPADQPPAQTDSRTWQDPSALLEALSDQQMIDLLLELPEDIRWALLLVDVEGLELKDAAVVMDVPTGTVKSRLHRGRGMLRDKLALVEGAKP